MRSLLFAVVLLILFTSTDAFSKKLTKERPEEMKEIIAHAICLAEGYPTLQIARDAEVVASTYIAALGSSVSSSNLAKVRRLAKEAEPSRSTTVDQRNFAIAKCVLFSHREDVRKLL